MDDICKVRSTLNNIKKHDYTVGDYKLCKNESDLVVALLERQLKDLEFDAKMKEPIV